MISFRSKAYYRILLGLSRLTEHSVFRPMHLAIRWIYRYVVVWALDFAVRFKYRHKGSLKLVSRHSVQESGSFNVFLSDIDLSIYLDHDLESERQEILSDLSHFKKWLPFLGEVEMYRCKDAPRVAELLRRVGPQYLFLRNLRKIGWMEYAWGQSQTDYHRFKAIRAIRNCLAKLGVLDFQVEGTGSYSLLGDALNGVLSKLLPPLRITDGQERCLEGRQVFSYFLGAPVGISKSLRLEHNRDTLVLSVATGLAFLAISPIHSYEDPEIQAAVLNARTHPQIRSLFNDLTEIEFRVFEAVGRAQRTEEPWLRYWESWIRPTWDHEA